MGRAVQYRGTPSILKAFDSAGIVAWGLCYDKRFIAKHAGGSFDDSKIVLQEWLKKLEKSNTTAEYQLCLYEDIKDVKKIRANMEPDMCWNVVLFDSDEYPSPGQQSRREGYAMIMDRLDLLEAKIAVQTPAEEQDDEEEEAVGSTSRGLLGMIDKILDNPQVQEKLGEKFIQLFDGMMSPQNSLPMQTATADTMGSPGEMPQVTQEQADKIQQAVSILAGVDPQLGDHLLKIAQVAQQKPQKYRNLITMLNTFL